jgi:hypothetical protein
VKDEHDIICIDKVFKYAHEWVRVSFLQVHLNLFT